MRKRKYWRKKCWMCRKVKKCSKWLNRTKEDRLCLGCYRKGFKRGFWYKANEKKNRDRVKPMIEIKEVRSE